MLECGCQAKWNVDKVSAASITHHSLAELSSEEAETQPKMTEGVTT